MVKFILLTPNGDISDTAMSLVAKDRMKPIQTILKKKKSINGKMTNLLVSLIKTKGNGKLTEISRWKIDDKYKLAGFGYLGETSDLNNHELPPCSNACNKYYGDICIFKIDVNDRLIDITTDEY